MLTVRQVLAIGSAVTPAVSRQYRGCPVSFPACFWFVYGIQKPDKAIACIGLDRSTRPS
jgi:hypothetical protein